MTQIKKIDKDNVNIIFSPLSMWRGVGGEVY
jgi:hypothetical protein